MPIHKQEASSKTVEEIQNDPKLTNREKTELISKLNSSKANKYIFQTIEKPA